MSNSENNIVLSARKQFLTQYQYRELQRNYCDQQIGISRDKIAKLQKKIEWHNRKIHRLEKEKSQYPYVSWLEVYLRPILVEIKRLTPEIQWSFDSLLTLGLRSTCSVFGTTKDNKEIGLTFTTDLDQLFYDTGETTNEYAPNTLGAINGLNNIVAKVENISQLVQYVQQQIPDREKDLTPYRLDQIWVGLGNMLFDEEADGEMVLAEDYYIWKAGTSRNYIWQWFDQHYPEGLGKHQFND